MKTTSSVKYFISNNEDLKPKVDKTKMMNFSDNSTPCQRQDETRGWWCIFGVSLVLVSDKLKAIILEHRNSRTGLIEIFSRSSTFRLFPRLGFSLNLFSKAIMSQHRL